MTSAPEQQKEPPHPYPFWLDAKHFFDVAELSFGEIRAGMPVVHRGFVPWFVLCHAIELALKAFLLARGHKVGELASKKKGFSHNLCALLAAASKDGLDKVPGFKPTRPIDGLVGLLSWPHEQRHFGYHEAWLHVRLPYADQALQSTRELIEAVGTVCPPPFQRPDTR